MHPCKTLPLANTWDPRGLAVSHERGSPGLAVSDPGNHVGRDFALVKQLDTVLEILGGVAVQGRGVKGNSLHPH